MDGLFLLSQVINSNIKEDNMINYKKRLPVKEPKIILKVIEDAIKQNDNIYALFLESSALESYLSSMLIISRKSNEKPYKGVIDSIQKMNFRTLLTVNNVLGNIDNDLYKRLNKFYDERNKIAHEMIGIDFNDAQNNESIKFIIDEGFKLCAEVSKIHESKLEKFSYM